MEQYFSGLTLGVTLWGHFHCCVFATGRVSTAKLSQKHGYKKISLVKRYLECYFFKLITVLAASDWCLHTTVELRSS